MVRQILEPQLCTRLLMILKLILTGILFCGAAGQLQGKGKPVDGGGPPGGDNGGGTAEPIPVTIEVTSTTVDEIFSDGGGIYETSGSTKTLVELNGTSGALNLDTNTSKRSGGGRTMSFKLKRGLLQQIGIPAGGGSPDELVNYSPEQVEIETDAAIDLRTIGQGAPQSLSMIIKTFGTKNFWLYYGSVDGSIPVTVFRENLFTWTLSANGSVAVHGPDHTSGAPAYGFHDVSFSMRMVQPGVTEPPPPPPPSEPITIVETGYRHVSLNWNDNETWDYPWLIQRSTSPNFVDPTDLTHNQATDNTGTGTFRWLGINASNYTDIDGLDEETTYYYRVAVCTNLSAHYQTGAIPTFGEWITGSTTTTTLTETAKLIYDVTQAPYYAIPGDGLNDYPAIKHAFDDAELSGGGIIYLPAGTYDIWPTDPDVDIVEGIPTLDAGETVSSSLFHVTSPNITFLGDTSAGEPTTLISLYLWGKEPATKWLEVMSAGPDSVVVDVRRYFVWKVDAESFTLRNLDIDMGAVPVDTGKQWYGIDDARYQWDISHKLIANFGNPGMRNMVLENISARNCRGEVVYNGGGAEKVLIKHCEFRRTNSSTISGSFDLELVNTLISESANAAVESAIFNDKVSGFTGKVHIQNHIARGCTFIGLDQSADGTMKDLPGKKNFAGWMCFNEENTFQSVTDCTFSDFVATAFGPWYEYRNGLRFNCTFNNFPGELPGNMIYTWTSAQGNYQLDGGMSEILWLGDTINITKSWPNHQVFFYSQPGGAALDSETPWVWEAVHFNNTGGTHWLNRLWLDTWWLTSGRQEVVWKDWTKDPDLLFDANYLYATNENHIDPVYINFFE
jgi:hypothetical protein